MVARVEGILNNLECPSQEMTTLSTPSTHNTKIPTINKVLHTPKVAKETTAAAVRATKTHGIKTIGLTMRTSNKTEDSSANILPTSKAIISMVVAIPTITTEASPPTTNTMVANNNIKAIPSRANMAKARASMIPTRLVRMVSEAY